ncbi:hypothetical protein FHG87_022760 [Trinorchestia longiramus]|nr:hypothetical protein FHG87_022760 [Trinorchestia longiramus]
MRKPVPELASHCVTQQLKKLVYVRFVFSYLIKYAIPTMNLLLLLLLPLRTTISLAQVFPITVRDVAVEGLVIVQTAKSMCEYPVKVCPLLYV